MGSGFFDVMDGGFFRILSRIGDLFILNFMFLLCCLPIITIGPALVAMYTVTFKMLDNSSKYVAKEYLEAFKENFKKAMGAWLVVLPIGLLIILDVFIARHLSGGISGYIKFFVMTCAFVFLIWAMYIFPMMSKFENTVKNTLLNSFFMSIRYFPMTVPIFLINLASPLLFYFGLAQVKYGLLLFITISCSFCAFVNTIIFNRVFRVMINKQ